MKSKLNLTIEELRKYRYPNLMAEVQETTYSICTIAEHMRLGKYRKEDDAETWRKLTGTDEIYTDEGIALCNLFGVNFEYLFSGKLKMFQGETAAYWRWFDRKEQIDKLVQMLEKRKVGETL